jgi:methylated-DNA-[protein]-cysteine S-methyltransferase
VAIVLPCHRVIGANGSLTGYAGGLPTKQALLEFEATVVAADEPVAFERSLPLA